MDKRRRKELEWLKYKKRLYRWICTGGIIRNREGKWMENFKLADALKERAQYKLKHTAVLCSCEGCSGMYKYRRHEVKKETQRLLKEFNEGF